MSLFAVDVVTCGARLPTVSSCSPHHIHTCRSTKIANKPVCIVRVFSTGGRGGVISVSVGACAGGPGGCGLSSISVIRRTVVVWMWSAAKLSYGYPSLDWTGLNPEISTITVATLGYIREADGECTELQSPVLVNNTEDDCHDTVQNPTALYQGPGYWCESRHPRGVE